MSVSRIAVFAQADLVELLADEPGLLAVADAIAETQRGRRRFLWTSRLTAVAVAAALALALLVVSPWQSSRRPSLVDRALAAVGLGPVVHAVLEPDGGPQLTNVDLATGRERPLLDTTEIWFDETRHLEHTLFRIDGRLQEDMLQTPTEVVTPQHAGPFPGPPTLDPALAEFVDRYRAALRSGRATPAADGSVDGHAVIWLVFTLDNGDSQRVAIDKQTALPLRVETSSRGGGSTWSYTIRQIEALPEGSGNFTPPRVHPGPEPEAFMREPMPIAPEAATRVVPGALAVGPAFEGLALNNVLETKLSTIFKPEAHTEPLVAKGLEFEYGSDSLLDGRPFLWIEEATQAARQYDWFTPALSPGDLLTSRPEGVPPASGGASGWVGLMAKNGLYITIRASDRALMLDAARSLEPFSAP